MKTKGDVISEKEVIERIHEAVRSILESDVSDTIKLHNLICEGELTVHESEGGEPLDVDGRVVEEPENEAWGYLFTKDEDEKQDWKCPKCGTTQVV